MRAPPRRSILRWIPARARTTRPGHRARSSSASRTSTLAHAVETARQRFRVADRDVQNDGHGDGKIGREGRDEARQSLGAPGRCPHDGDFALAAAGRHLDRPRERQRGRHPRRRRGEHFGHELVGKLVEPLGGEGGRLVHQVEGAARESLDAELAVRVGHADHDHARRIDGRQRAQHAYPVEPGHHQIERDDVRREVGDLLQRFEAVARDVDDVDALALAQDFAQHFARESGVVDDQDTNGAGHDSPLR